MQAAQSDRVGEHRHEVAPVIRRDVGVIDAALIRRRAKPVALAENRTRGTEVGSITDECSARLTQVDAVQGRQILFSSMSTAPSMRESACVCISVLNPIRRKPPVNSTRRAVSKGYETIPAASVFVCW
jgi:hypothetical protein